MTDIAKKLPPIADCTDWHIVALPDEYHLQAHHKATNAKGSVYTRTCIVRYAKHRGATVYRRWTILSAAKYQEVRSRHVPAADAAHFRFIRGFVMAALCAVSDDDLQVWSEGRAPARAALLSELLSELPAFSQ